jgi:sugar phosphate isomerase/epimerase
MPYLSAIAPFGFNFDPVRFLAAYRSLGAGAAQFYRNEQKPPSVAEARRAAESVGMSYDSIHGVFGFHLDPSSPDPDHRKRCVQIYADEGRLARDLGGPMVVVHPAAFNPGMKMMSRQEAEAAALARWPRLIQFMFTLAQVGERLGVTYLIENQPLSCPIGWDAVALAGAIQQVNSPWIRMCLDTGHAHMTGNLAEITRQCLPVISYIHVHDNDGQIDDHRMPFDGNIDWAAFAAVLRQAGAKVPRMLEVFYDEARVEALAAAGLGRRLSKALDLPESLVAAA